MILNQVPPHRNCIACQCSYQTNRLQNEQLQLLDGTPLTAAKRPETLLRKSMDRQWPLISTSLSISCLEAFPLP